LRALDAKHFDEGKSI